MKKPASVRQKTKIWSWAPHGSPTPRQTDRITVGRKLASTSRATPVQLMTIIGLLDYWRLRFGLAFQWSSL
jgi:hypothetical protein